MPEDKRDEPVAWELFPSTQPVPNYPEQINAWGYSRSDDELLEMREVTFNATPDALRDVARFLTETADLLASGQFKHSHEHIESFVSDWRTRFPQIDFIVCHPGFGNERPVGAM
jgi:hypothetical protein